MGSVSACRWARPARLFGKVQRLRRFDFIAGPQILAKLLYTEARRRSVPGSPRGPGPMDKGDSPCLAMNRARTWPAADALGSVLAARPEARLLRGRAARQVGHLARRRGLPEGHGGRQHHRQRRPHHRPLPRLRRHDAHHLHTDLLVLQPRASTPRRTGRSSAPTTRSLARGTTPSAARSWFSAPGEPPAAAWRGGRRGPPAPAALGVRGTARSGGSGPAGTSAASFARLA